MQPKKRINIDLIVLLVMLVCLALFGYTRERAVLELSSVTMAGYFGYKKKED